MNATISKKKNFKIDFQVCFLMRFQKLIIIFCLKKQIMPITIYYFQKINIKLQEVKIQNHKEQEVIEENQRIKMNNLNLFLVKRSLKVSPFNEKREEKKIFNELKKKHKKEYLPSSNLEKRKFSLSVFQKLDTERALKMFSKCV